MAQINTYSPTSDARVCVQYARGQSVGVGVQRAVHPIVTVDGQDAPGVDATVPPVIDPDTGVWADLDRAGINNLIRSLREARDKAFGKDE